MYEVDEMQDKMETLSLAGRVAWLWVDCFPHCGEMATGMAVLSLSLAAALQVFARLPVTNWYTSLYSIWFRKKSQISGSQTCCKNEKSRKYFQSRKHLSIHQTFTHL